MFFSCLLQFSNNLQSKEKKIIENNIQDNILSLSFRINFIINWLEFTITIDKQKYLFTKKRNNNIEELKPRLKSRLK